MCMCSLCMRRYPFEKKRKKKQRSWFLRRNILPTYFAWLVFRAWLTWMRGTVHCLAASWKNICDRNNIVLPSYMSSSNCWWQLLRIFTGPVNQMEIKLNLLEMVITCRLLNQRIRGYCRVVVRICCRSPACSLAGPQSAWSRFRGCSPGFKR